MKLFLCILFFASGASAQVVVEFSPTLKRALVGTTNCTMSLHTPTADKIQVWCYFTTGPLPADLPKNTVQHVDAQSSEVGAFRFANGIITWVVTPNPTDPTKMNWQFAASKDGGPEVMKQGTN